MNETTTYRQAYADSSKQGFYATGLFLVWPALAALSALRNFRKSWAKNIFWAFCAFYGMTFAIGQESQGHDIVRYIAEYQMLHGRPMGIDEILAYFRNSGEIDILRTALAYIVSRFTDSAVALTVVYATIFGFFLSRNLWFLLDRLEGTIKPVTVLLLTCFFLVNPIWEINAFRMWTAVNIFIYGLLPYLFDGKKYGILIAALSILVHFSFVVPVGVLAMYIVAGNRFNVYYGFYVATYFFSELDLEAFNAIVEAYLPEMFQERTRGYRHEGAIKSDEEKAASMNWYVIWFGRALRYSILGYLTVLYITGRNFFKEKKRWANLFSFTLLFYSVANFFSLLPSGSRYQVIGHLCALALIIFSIQNRPKEKAMSFFVWVSLPALLLFIVVTIRVGLYSMSAAFILGNPILTLFIGEENLSLNDVLRMII